MWIVTAVQMLEDAAAAQRKIVMQEAEEKQLRAQVCDLNFLTWL